MLKGIPKILSPQLLKVLCEMGHGDRIVIGDGNFPAESVGRNSIVVRCDGLGVPELLEAILAVIPLDAYIEKPVNLMQVVPGDNVATPIWDTFFGIIGNYDMRGEYAVGYLERYEFYEQSKSAYAMVATSEKALYANLILQKGVITD